MANKNIALKRVGLLCLSGLSSSDQLVRVCAAAAEPTLFLPSSACLFVRASMQAGIVHLIWDMFCVVFLSCRSLTGVS